MICHVTGSIRSISGTIPVGTVLSFVRCETASANQSVVMPGTQTTVPKITGEVDVSLYAGRYRLCAHGRQLAHVSIPNTDAADLADVIDWGVTTLITPVVEWHRGADNSLVFTLREEDGEPPDFLGLSLHIKVCTPVGELVIPSVQSPECDADYEIDLSSCRLPMGTFFAEIWLNDGSGETLLRCLALRIIEDCHAKY